MGSVYSPLYSHFSSLTVASTNLAPDIACLQIFNPSSKLTLSICLCKCSAIIPNYIIPN